MAVDENTPLDARQSAFVAEYLVDLNAMQAAIRSGYSAHTAASIASELLTRPNIAAAVARGKAQRAARVNVTQDQVLQEMSLLANSCVEHYHISDDGQVVPAEGAPDGCMRAIQSIKKKTRILKDGGHEYDVELRLWDKPNPLKLMGRHVGLFADRVEVTGANGGPLDVRRMTDAELADEAARIAVEAAALAKRGRAE